MSGTTGIDESLRVIQLLDELGKLYRYLDCTRSVCTTETTQLALFTEIKDLA